MLIEIPSKQNIFYNLIFVTMNINFRELSYSIIVMFVGAFILFLNGCATSESARQRTLSRSEVGSLMIERRASEYVIKPGDQIEVSVFGYDEFNATKTVSSRGIIVVPLVGEVEAEGITKEEFKANLKQKLTEYIKGEFNLSVSITSTQENIISVLGSVGRPDNYSVVDKVSLFEILSKAGGTTEQADLRNIKIYQEGQSGDPLQVDLTRYLKQGNASRIAEVYPGDIVFVPKQENMIRELSSFMRDVVLLFGLFRVFN